MATECAPRQRTHVRHQPWLRAVLLCGGFVLLGVVAALLATPPSRQSSVWLPAGLSLAVVFRAERREWPLLLAAVFLAEVLLVRSFGGPLPLALVWGVGNVLRTLLGAWLLQRWVGLPMRFNRLRDVMGLLLVGGLLSPLPSATLGALGRAFLTGGDPSWGTDSLWSGWVTWWLSDVLGTVVMAPLVLTWWPLRQEAHPLVTALRWQLFLAMVLLSAFILFESGAPYGVVPSLPYAGFPILLWASVAMGPRGASTASGLLGGIVLWLTSRGRGVFGTLPLPHEGQLLSAQAYVAVITLSALVVAALMCERQWAARTQHLLARASADLAHSLDAHETLPELARRLVPDLSTGFAAWVLPEKGEAEVVVREGVSPALEEELGERLRALPGPQPWTDPRGRAVIAPLCGGERVAGAIALVSEDRLAPLGSRELALVKDLAYRCQLALESTHRYEEAKDAILRRDEFIALTAHELRTPLTAFRLQLGGLSRQLAPLQPPATVWERLRVLERQEARLSRLVESLLEVSRLQVEHVPLEREVVNLAGLVCDVAERLAPELERAHCPLVLHVEEDVRGEWDRLRLEQALTHLLGNALKFGAGHPVEVEATRQGERARVSVRDHGIGMHPEVLSRIFDRFEQAVPAREYGGLGIGLYLTRQIAESHGGRVWATSEPGEGATFVLELPALPRAAAPEEAPGPTLH